MAKSNGHAKSSVVTNRMIDEELSLAYERQANAMLSFVKNETSSRIEAIRKLTETRVRDINHESGYPEGDISNVQYKEMYDREGIASRIVNIYPQECWAMQPEIYETEDLENVTKFEKELETLDEEVQLYSKMETVDKLCGIGRYGIMLLGFSGSGSLKTPLRPIDKVGKRQRLLYMRPLPEFIAQISDYERDIRNPRYGHPTMYKLKLIDSTELSKEGNVIPTDAVDKISRRQDVDVHWSRVVHVPSDELEDSVIYGTPRLQSVFNRCYDIKKILSASAEGYWKCGYPGLSLETHPTTEAIDFGDEEQQKTKDQIERFQLGLQRYLATVGVTVKSLSPSLVDPSPFLRAQLEAISIAKQIPLRILQGSEEAKLASSQDMRTWNKRLRHRQIQFINSYIIRPILNRLMEMGALTKPKKLTINWPDLNAPTENDRAVTAAKITDALVKYISGKVFLVMPPKEFLTIVLGYPLPQVESLLKSIGPKIKQLDTMFQTEMKAMTMKATPATTTRKKAGQNKSGTVKKEKSDSGAGRA
jgi:hypothetical protein